jgi:hypothetical protein
LPADDAPLIRMPRLCSRKLPDRDVAALDRTQEIGFDQPAVIIQRNLVEAADCPDPGVVDPDVDAAEFGHRPFRQPLDLVANFDEIAVPKHGRYVPEDTDATVSN